MMLLPASTTLLFIVILNVSYLTFSLELKDTNSITTETSCYRVHIKDEDNPAVELSFDVDGRYYVIQSTQQRFLADHLHVQGWSSSGYKYSDSLDGLNGCYFYGNVTVDAIHFGYAMLDRCEDYTGTILSEDGQQNVITKSKDLLQTHCLSDSTDETNPSRERLKRSLSERLSPNRKLNAHTSVFIDKEYADKFYANFSSKREDLVKHVMGIMKDVQKWYLLPSLGYRIYFTIVKLVILDETIDKLGYNDFAGFCRFQSTFLPGGTRSGGSEKTWGITIYFSGVYGVFGYQPNSKNPIWGRAFMAGACDPIQMCSGANDHFNTNEYMARLITHETGHLFDMPDDYNEPYLSRCPEGMMKNQFNGMFWSKCSVDGLRQFLRSEKSSCLDEIPFMNDQKLVPLSTPVVKMVACPADGHWSGWTPYNDCSRDCGVGVRISNRSCSNPAPGPRGRVCIGAAERYKDCQIKSCVKKDTTRKEQVENECELLGMKKRIFPEDKSLYTVNGTDRCEIRCSQKGKSLYSPMTPKDGFSCSDTQKDVCIRGICTPRGCDDSFTSDKRFDNCGVCGGSGESCHLVSLTYNGQKKGYTQIRLVPEGSRHILVELLAINLNKAKGNIIHVADENYNQVPTLRVRENDSGFHRIVYAGATWEYVKTGQLRHLLRSRGPTTSECYIVLQRLNGADRNPGVKISFVAPK